MESITAALGGGSGLDIKALVTGLVAAQFDPKTAALTKRDETLTAQISSLAQLRGGLVGFSNALGSLIGSGQLTTQPVSGDATLFTARAKPGATLGALAHEIEVRALATGQSLASAALAGPAAQVGTGTLTIRFGTATTDANGALTGFAADVTAQPVSITIGAGDNSLAGLARAINAGGAGLSASVVGDGSEARLSIRGPSGAARAFAIEAVEADIPGLSRFSFTAGAATTMSVGRTATDARIALDGIEVRRAGNSVGDLVEGVTIDLIAAELGRPVSLSSARPTAAIGAAVSDFVGAFNELRAILRSETDPVSGALGGESAARAMARELGSLTATRLVEGAPAGAPSTLAEIGVRTNRDGTLSVDATRLNAALAAWPDVVEAMFNPRQSSSNPLVSVTSAIARAAPGVYEVAGLVPATAGRLTGTMVPEAFATPVVVDASNNLLSLALNGGTVTDLTIAPGSYASGAALVEALNAAVAATPALSGRVSAAWADNRLTFSSALEGSGSAVALTVGDATLATRIGLTGATATDGTAAAGTIAGMAATYAGGIFTAAADSPARGLMIRADGQIASASVRIDLGLGAALTAIAERLTGAGSGLAAAQDRYAQAQARIAEEQAKADAAAERLTDQLTRQFASMEARVAAYKSTQSFLEQQIKVWTADR